MLSGKNKATTCSLYTGTTARVPTMVYGSWSSILTTIDHGRHNEESAQVPTPDTSQLDDAALWSAWVYTRGCGRHKTTRGYAPRGLR